MPQFADADPTITRQVDREQSDFDKLFGQFCKAGAEIYGEQMRAMTKDVIPGAELK